MTGEPQRIFFRGRWFTVDPRAQFRFKPALSSTVTIGGRTYIERDDGRANVLVPVEAPPEQTRSANRTAFIAEHPLGAAAYGIASLFKTPEPVRDLSLAAGAVVDTVLLGGGILKVKGQAARPVPQRNVAFATPLPQATQSYGELDDLGRPTGARGWVTKETLGTGTKSDRRLTPPGWRGNGTLFNEARGHLYPRSAGGLGEEIRNVVTLTQRPTNTPKMSGVEAGVTKAARKGEVIDYSATPLYMPGGAAPSHVLIIANGSRGYSRAVVIPNPAGMRK